MKYRRFRTQNGSFLDALLTSDGEFNTPAESHRADHEAGYGVALTVVEGDTDPWDGVSPLVTRATPKPDLDPDRSAIRAILDKADVDITAGELKTLTLRALRRLHNRGRL